MPNPASSEQAGAIYAWISSWAKGRLGFMDKLHRTSPLHALGLGAVRAGGERTVTIGIGFDMRGAKERPAAPIDIILARKARPGTWKPAIQGHPNLAAAESRGLRRQQAGLRALRQSTPSSAIGMNPAPPNYPPSADAAMVKIDLAKMGEDRANPAEWTSATIPSRRRNAPATAH